SRDIWSAAAPCSGSRRHGAPARDQRKTVSAWIGKAPAAPAVSWFSTLTRPCGGARPGWPSRPDVAGTAPSHFDELISAPEDPNVARLRPSRWRSALPGAGLVPAYLGLMRWASGAGRGRWLGRRLRELGGWLRPGCASHPS